MKQLKALVISIIALALGVAAAQGEWLLRPSACFVFPQNGVQFAGLLSGGSIMGFGDDSSRVSCFPLVITDGQLDLTAISLLTHPRYASYRTGLIEAAAPTLERLNTNELGIRVYSITEVDGIVANETSARQQADTDLENRVKTFITETVASINTSSLDESTKQQMIDDVTKGVLEFARQEMLDILLEDEVFLEALSEKLSARER